MPKTPTTIPSFVRGPALDLFELLPNMDHPMNKRPDRSDRKDPKHLRHSIGEIKLGVPIPGRQRPDNKQYDALRPLKKPLVRLFTESFAAGCGIPDKNRSD